MSRVQSKKHRVTGIIDGIDLLTHRCIEETTPGIWPLVWAAWGDAMRDPMFLCSDVLEAACRHRRANVIILVAEWPTTGRIKIFNCLREAILKLNGASESRVVHSRSLVDIKIIENMRRMKDEHLTIPRLEQSHLPSPILLRGKLEHVRDIDAFKIHELLKDSLIPNLATLHDPMASLFQTYLDALAESACPDLESNQALANSLRDIADASGLGLYRDEAAGLRQVRVYCEAAKGWPTGRFSARPVDRKPPQSYSAVWPRLVARSLVSGSLVSSQFPPKNRHSALT